MKIKGSNQSRIGSLIESFLNVGSGFIIAWILTIFIIPAYTEKSLSVYNSFEITLIYTGVSILRTYIWRRIFNE